MDDINIVLTRIDNRLVHGQVGVTWCKTVGANLVVVADDIAAEDDLQQQLMEMTAKSSGVDIRFFTVAYCAEIIGNASPDQKILIICRTPKEVRYLVEKGVPIKNVNVGNMHFVQGKKKLDKKVYVDDEEEAALKYLVAQGVKVFIQDVPGDTIINL